MRRTDRVVLETANIYEVRVGRKELLDILDGDALAVVQRLGAGQAARLAAFARSNEEPIERPAARPIPEALIK